MAAPCHRELRESSRSDLDRHFNFNTQRDIPLNRDPQEARALLLKHVGRIPLRPTDEGYRWDGEFTIDEEEAICWDPENRRPGGRLSPETLDPAGSPQRDSQVSQAELVAGAGLAKRLLIEGATVL